MTDVYLPLDRCNASRAKDVLAAVFGILAPLSPLPSFFSFFSPRVTAYAVSPSNRRGRDLVVKKLLD